jgi:hypothetical protein
MTDQPSSSIGTVAQEAARLIEDMAAMARLGYAPADSRSPSAGEPAQEHVSPAMGHVAGTAQSHAPEGHGSGRDGSAGFGSEVHEPDGFEERAQWSAHICSECGAERQDVRGDGPPGADTPRNGGDGESNSGGETLQNCRLCPLCRGIAVLRSVRPETVDLLADLAISVAASLREVAMRSRASDSPSSARSNPGAQPPDAGRAPVQDIPVDDESEG